MIQRRNSSFLAPPKNVGKVVEWTVDVGDVIIIPSGSVRNIGAMLNPTLNMETHIICMKRACYFLLRSLSKIRKYLTQEAAEKLTHAFVTSRLDNLHSLLINTPSFQVQQLQLIQNIVTRIVTQESSTTSHPSSKIFTGYLLLLVLI